MCFSLRGICVRWVRSLLFFAERSRAHSDATAVPVHAHGVGGHAAVLGCAIRCAGCTVQMRASPNYCEPFVLVFARRRVFFANRLQGRCAAKRDKRRGLSSRARGEHLWRALTCACELHSHRKLPRLMHEACRPFFLLRGRPVPIFKFPGGLAALTFHRLRVRVGVVLCCRVQSE